MKLTSRTLKVLSTSFISVLMASHLAAQETSPLHTEKPIENSVEKTDGVETPFGKS